MVTKAREKAKPQTRMTLMANEAVAWAARLARVAVTYHFPIGPSDEVGQTMAEFYDSGVLKGKCVELQAEDETVAAWAGTASNGVRTIYSTNSQGIKKSWPCLSSMARLPVVLPNPHRLFTGGVVMPDWHAQITLRDVGWLFIHGENSQECLDLMLQAYKVAEDPDVRLPIMLGYDGWEVSHSNELVDVPSQEDVDKFLPPYRGPSVMTSGDWRDAGDVRLGRSATQIEDAFPEATYKRHESAAIGKALFQKVDKEYGDLFGRYWGGILDDSLAKGCDVVIITMGALLSTARCAMEVVRESGLSAGVLKLRWWNPFPKQEVIQALKGAKVVIAVDRDEVGYLTQHLRSALYDVDPRIKVLGRLAGLSGTTPTVDDMVGFFEEGMDAVKGKKVVKYGWHLKGTAGYQGVKGDPNYE